MRRKPVYRSASTGSNTHLRVVSDAAYKKETDDGYSLRGALYCRGTGTARESFVGQKTPVHIVDWVSTSQRHVTRSTFSAELLAAEDAVDQGILISHVLCELEYGPMDARAARDRRMEGGYLFFFALPYKRQRIRTPIGVPGRATPQTRPGLRPPAPAPLPKQSRRGL